MTSTKRIASGLFAAASILLAAPQVFAAPIVLNGSFEDLNTSFSNTSCQYMALGAGSTAIANWTVGPATTNSIVWANSPTCDGFTASQAQFFVDLSGFGGFSPDGSLQQQLATTINQSYLFTIDLATINDGAVSVMVGATSLTLTPGAPFLAGSTSWTPYSATFVASSGNPLLTIGKVVSGANIVFVDNVSIVAQGSTVPEPASLALLGLGFATLGARRRLRRER